jgi:hypothetical protein
MTAASAPRRDDERSQIGSSSGLGFSPCPGGGRCAGLPHKKLASVPLVRAGVADRGQVLTWDLLRVRDRRALAATCSVGRMWLVNWQEAGPPVTVVVRCNPVVRGPDVAPMWPPGSRAWKARPGTPLGRDDPVMAQLSDPLDRPLLSVGHRQGPVLRARGGTAGEDQAGSGVAAMATT